VVVGLAPLSGPEAKAMIRGIKGHALLAGFRGETGVDLGAVEDVLLRVSRLAADFPHITELDLNPVFVHPAGTAPAVVDVRLKVE
jgi:acyl-CoA synthetase (NDP forming)